MDLLSLVKRVEWLDPATDTWQVVTEYTRSLAGAPRTQHSSFANQTRAFTYDELGRVTADTISADGATVANRSYGFNQAGDLTTVGGATNGISAAASFTYDRQHRLRTASGPNGYRGEFTYSPAGNVLSANVSWSGSPQSRHVQYEYGDLDPQAVDRLIDVGSGQNHGLFSYDLAGNMTTRSTPAGHLEMTWDSRDRIRLVEGPNGAELYYYDHAGTRLLAINEQSVRFWFAESETHYDLDGTQTRRYLHLSDTNSVVARVENGTDIELQYADALQNLMVSLDADGNESAAFFYGAFGEVVQETGADDHRRQFNGKEHDAISGLRYYGFRYYDPLTLRWNSADPLYRFVPEVGLADPQRLNLYAFSLNNPLTYFDPDGRNPYALIFDRAISALIEIDGIRAGGDIMRKVNAVADKGRQGARPNKVGLKAGASNNLLAVTSSSTLKKQQWDAVLSGKIPSSKAQRKSSRRRGLMRRRAGFVQQRNEKQSEMETIDEAHADAFEVYNNLREKENRTESEEESLSKAEEELEQDPWAAHKLYWEIRDLEEKIATIDNVLSDSNE